MRTVGLEEEFLVLDSDGQLASATNFATPPGGDGGRIKAELFECQIEAVTPPCSTWDQLSISLYQNRLECDALARAQGKQVVSLGMHPMASLSSSKTVDAPAFDLLLEQYGTVLTTTVACGLHVHIGVDNSSDALTIVNYARTWIPLLTAIAANSPYCAGEDTGFASYRTIQYSRWPTFGPPPLIDTKADLNLLVASLMRARLIDNPRRLYWMIRPSPRFPTVEFRAFDAAPSAVAGMALAIMCHGIADLALMGRPTQEVNDVFLRCAIFDAARNGWKATILNPITGLMTSLDIALQSVMEALEAVSTKYESDRVGAFLYERSQRGGFDSIQREAASRTGQLSSVIAWARNQFLSASGR